MIPFLPQSAQLKRILLTGMFIFCTHLFVKAQFPEIPITVTGFTEDVIADAVLNTVPTTVTTNSIDNPGTNIFYAQGYSSNAVPLANGLPVTGQFISSAGHHFQLAAYNGNNDLRLEALGTGTLTFAAQDQREYSNLYILATGGDNSPIVNYTIHFTDATTATGGFTVLDWFCNNCTPYAIRDVGRAQRPVGNFNGNQFAIREYPINLVLSDQAKQISSIDFSVPSGELGVANIFGVTGLASTSALPVSLEYFNARPENGRVILQWKTAQEFKNKQFIIDRATAAQPSVFLSDGKVLATSSPNGAVYTFTDVPALSGTYLYRLSQEDVDGNIKILGVRSITIGNKNTWVVQDNGINWQLISSQPLKFRLIDMNGRLLRSYSGSGNVTIPKPPVRGIYELQIQTGSQFFTQKLLK